MKIDLSQVKSAYNGKDGKCCCGCSGKHTTDLATISRIVKKIEAAENIDEGGSYVAATVGTRLYIAYYY